MVITRKTAILKVSIKVDDEELEVIQEIHGNIWINKSQKMEDAEKSKEGYMQQYCRSGEIEKD